MRAAHPGLAPVALPQRLLMPGLIDTHTHLTQSFGKALAFGEPSEIFRRIWVPMESMLDADAAYLAAKLSALESLRGGFTTVVDAGTRSEAGLDAVASAARDAGIRCVLGMICNDAGLDGDEAGTRRILDAAASFLARLEHDPLVHPSLAISIPEAATDRMLHDVAALTRESGRRFQTHVNEHLAAVERSLVARGLRPLELLHACGALNASALLAHATLLTPRELGLLRDSGAAVAYNPVASQWKGNAVLDAGLLAHAGRALRPRHRRHARRRLPADGRGRGHAAPHARPGQRRLVLRRRLALARPRHAPRRRGRRPRRASPAASRKAWPPTSCCSTSTCRSSCRAGT